MIYLIGSLRNPRIPEIAEIIHDDTGYEIFADWFAPGPEADDNWKKYAQARGQSYSEALNGYAATQVFEFDRKHIMRASAVVLVMPAGKSGHMELGIALGKGKPGYILFPDGEPPADRWDVMIKFATEIFFNIPDLTMALLNNRRVK